MVSRFPLLTLILVCVGGPFSLFAELSEIAGANLIIIGKRERPTLQFVCLKKTSFPQEFRYAHIIENPMSELISISLDLSHLAIESEFLLSTTRASEFNEWAMLQPLLTNSEVITVVQDSISSPTTNLLNKIPEKVKAVDDRYDFYKTSFLADQTSERIESFDYGTGFLGRIGREMIDFSIDRQLEEMKNYALSEKLLLERNDSRKAKLNDPWEELRHKNAQDESGLAKFAVYVLIAGGAFCIYAVLAPAGSQGKESTKQKAEKARRKRWLEKIYQLGWIDRQRYVFLLKRLENLPQWLGGIEPPDQSEESAVASDTSVDLSKRNSGESVVKTKETSWDNTSP